MVQKARHTRSLAAPLRLPACGAAVGLGGSNSFHLSAKNRLPLPGSWIGSFRRLVAVEIIVGVTRIHVPANRCCIGIIRNTDQAHVCAIFFLSNICWWSGTSGQERSHLSSHTPVWAWLLGLSPWPSREAGHGQGLEGWMVAVGVSRKQSQKPRSTS